MHPAVEADAVKVPEDNVFVDDELDGGINMSSTSSSCRG
jgi:hypothetical protein